MHGDELNNALFDAMEAGLLEPVGDDKFRLTDKGTEDAEKLMLESTGALAFLLSLTLKEIKLSRKHDEMLDKALQMVFKQLEYKDRLIADLKTQLEQSK